ncbi:PLDc N-terminal domain-containing protein [Methanolobus sp.]
MFNGNNEKLIWIVVLVLLNIVGAILYFGFVLIKDNGENIGISEN